MQEEKALVLVLKSSISINTGSLDGAVGACGGLETARLPMRADIVRVSDEHPACALKQSPA